MGQEMIMKKRLLLILLTIASIDIIGQERFLLEVKQPVDSNLVEETSSLTLIEVMDVSDSNHTDTFSDAFNDPNIVIGVFEDAALQTISGNLSAKNKSIILQNSLKAITLNLRVLHLVKPIKGEFSKSLISVSMISPPSRGRFPTISFAPGSKWILALRKTTKDYCIERWGNEINENEFLNEYSIFTQFRFGYGALCLYWPKPDDEGIPPSRPNSILFVEPKGLVKVPESMIDDLEAIQKVVPLLQKENKDPNDTVAIEKTSQVLKNDLAKNIFLKLSMKKI